MSVAGAVGHAAGRAGTPAGTPAMPAAVTPLAPGGPPRRPGPRVRDLTEATITGLLARG